MSILKKQNTKLCLYLESNNQVEPDLVPRANAAMRPTCDIKTRHYVRQNETWIWSCNCLSNDAY